MHDLRRKPRFAVHQEGETRCNVAEQRLCLYGTKQMYRRSDTLHPFFASLLTLLFGLPLSSAESANAVRLRPNHVTSPRGVAKMIRKRMKVIMRVSKSRLDKIVKAKFTSFEEGRRKISVEEQTSRLPPIALAHYDNEERLLRIHQVCNSQESRHARSKG